ncbi:MAG: uroporphyrinogen-III synthase [Gemmobacter sp.]
MAAQVRPAATRPVLLLTRPDPGSSAFAAMAAARFGDRVQVLVAPLMEIAFLDAPLPAALAAAAGLVFTSAAGVAGLARLAPGLARPAWCVGERTARAAAEAGHAAQALGGDAEALVAALAAAPPPAPLVHVRGTESRGAVAARLSAAGIPTTEFVVYDQRPLPLGDAARAALAGPAPVIAPLFSPRSARLFAAAAAGAAVQAPLFLAPISDAAQAAAGGLHPHAVAIAPTPDAAGMLVAIEALLAAAPRA